MAKKTKQTDVNAALTSLVSELINEVRSLKSELATVQKRTPADLKDTKTAASPAKVKRAETPVENTIKARIELWSYDEYNQGSIVTSSNNLDKILTAAKAYCTEANVNNALAGGEKEKSWEAYFPVVFVDGEPSADVLYAGNKRDGKHYVYVRGQDKWELRRPDGSINFRFFLGNTSSGKNKDEWYLSDGKGRSIRMLDDIALDRKTVLFVKIV